MRNHWALLYIDLITQCTGIFMRSRLERNRARVTELLSTIFFIACTEETVKYISAMQISLPVR